MSKSSLIVKNTMMLYMRMAITMFISLYTSRIVLNALGVDDFGIHNVVGGVIGFFGFIIYSMQTAIQRFLTVAMGKGDYTEVQQVFSIGILIHILLALFIVLVGETIGLWFVENKLVIPSHRMDAALWIYHFVILGTVVSLISIPYTAEVVAHEKMGTFAYLSILNVFLNFGIAWYLLISPYDRLVTYGFLGLCVNVLSVCLYVWYCKRNFCECRFTHKFPRKLLKEMVSFAGWDFFGVIAYCVSTQGATIMLNMFFGPAVNAARAVAITGLDKVKSFSSNFTTALNPAISKAYGAGNYDYMFRLMYSGSKLVFILYMLLSFPALIMTHYLLEIWLKTVPEYSVEFVRILILQSLVLVMWNPLFVAGMATGKIKQFGLATSLCNILKMPVCYMLLVRGCSPNMFLLAYTILEIMAYGIQLFTMKSLLGFDWRDYVVKVQGRAILIMLVALPIPYYISKLMGETFLCLIIVFIMTTVLTVVLCLLFLLNNQERAYCISRSRAIIQKMPFLKGEE